MIAGRVVDGRTGAPLEAAAVTVGWSEWAVQDETPRSRPIETNVARSRGRHVPHSGRGEHGGAAHADRREGRLLLR